MKLLIIIMITWTIVFILAMINKEIRKSQYTLIYLSLMCMCISNIAREYQIKTQAEYIEWQECIKLDTQRESEHMNMLEEMRKGNE